MSLARFSELQVTIIVNMNCHIPSGVYQVELGPVRTFSNFQLFADSGMFFSVKTQSNTLAIKFAWSLFLQSGSNWVITMTQICIFMYIHIVVLIYRNVSCFEIHLFCFRKKDTLSLHNDERNPHFWRQPEENYFAPSRLEVGWSAVMKRYWYHLNDCKPSRSLLL